MIHFIFLIITTLIIWFNTEAFVEYVQLLRLPFFKIKEYTVAKQNDCSLTYHSYLLTHHNNFFTRLITCPTCTTFWLCVLCYLFGDINFIDIPVIFVFSLSGYYLFNKISP